MSCERILPLLPLLALETDAAGSPATHEARAAREHLRECERCARTLRELVATRAALSAFSVADSPATDPAEIRAAFVPDESRATPRRRVPWLLKAAAAAVLVGGAATFAWTHGSVTLDRGAATLRIAWGGGAGASADGFRDREDSLEPVAVATALSELEQRVERLEVRHEQDLLLLAKSVDRQQESRERDVTQRIRTLEEATHKGFVYTNSVLDGVASELSKTAGIANH